MNVKTLSWIGVGVLAIVGVVAGIKTNCFGLFKKKGEVEEITETEKPAEENPAEEKKEGEEHK